jgi:hypothetical protein
MNANGLMRRIPKRAVPAGSDGQSSVSEGQPVSSYEGILQGIGDGGALGWAADRSDPQARVTVAVAIDGEVVAEGKADIARPDLADMGLGDGAHGFLIRLPKRLQAPARRSIHVLAGPERIPLPVAPSFWQKPAADGTWSDVVFVAGSASSTPVAPPPERLQGRAIVEADGWLFLEEEEDCVQPSEAEFEGTIARLADNARKCAELGIAYIPALIPRKREVLGGARGDLPRRLRARLRDVDEVELLDLLRVLRDARPRGALYHRTDADWNDRGAFFVARALLKEAHKHERALRGPGLSDLHLRSLPEYRGTLADAARLERTADGLEPSAREVESEVGVVVDVSRLAALRMPVERHLAQTDSMHVRVYARAEHDEQARLAMVGDAAALSLMPWLAECTSRSSFFWADVLPLVQLELELPPVVFHLLRERDLFT